MRLVAFVFGLVVGACADDAVPPAPMPDAPVAGSASTNPCTISPCLNGGTCRAIGSVDYVCSCVDGYSGPTCATAPAPPSGPTGPTQCGPQYRLICPGGPTCICEPDPITVMVAISPDDPHYVGDPVTITITVVDGWGPTAPTGTVTTFYASSSQDCTLEPTENYPSACAITTEPLPGGQGYMRSVYNGDATHGAGYDRIMPLNVNFYPTTVDVAFTSPLVPGTVTATVHVTGQGPIAATGTIEASPAGSSCQLDANSTCTVTFDWSLLPAGASTSYEVIYDGDAYNASSFVDGVVTMTSP